MNQPKICNSDKETTTSSPFGAKEPDNQPETLSGLLEQVIDTGDEKLKLGDFAASLEKHGIAMFMIVFALPAAAPLPAVGYSTLCAIPLIFIAIRLILGSTSIWLPKKMAEKEFKPASLKPALSAVGPILKYLEKFTKPRLLYIAEGSLSTKLIGLIVLALAASMALPIPGTNTAPAFAVFILGFGMLQKDGLIIALGALASLAAICISLLIIFFGIEVLEQLKNLIS